MRASGYKRAVRDYYREPRWIVDALLDVEEFGNPCWDPACGSGNIPKACIFRGIECSGSDIEDRGYGSRQDFLEVSGPGSCDSIICNPPFGVVEAFVDMALTHTTNKVAILARLALLEGQCRRDWFARTPLARVWVSSRRVSMPPGDSDVPATGGSIAYAWFVWQHGYDSSPIIGWL